MYDNWCYHLLRREKKKATTKYEAWVLWGECITPWIRSCLQPADVLPLVEIPAWQACRSRFFLLFLSWTQNIVYSYWTRYPKYLLSLSEHIFFLELNRRFISWWKGCTLEGWRSQWAAKCCLLGGPNRLQEQSKKSGALHSAVPCSSSGICVSVLLSAHCRRKVLHLTIWGQPHNREPRKAASSHQNIIPADDRKWNFII